MLFQPLPVGINRTSRDRSTSNAAPFATQITNIHRAGRKKRAYRQSSRFKFEAEEKRRQADTNGKMG